MYLEKKICSTVSSKEWLNAGRGNPNWTAPVPREAYFLLGQFATQVTMREATEFAASMIHKNEHYGEAFTRFLGEHPGKGSAFLKDI